MIDLLADYGDMIVEGLYRTLILTLAGFFLGFAISILLTLVRFAGGPPLAILAEAYINFFRGTPLLVQLFLIFFGLPSLGVRLDAFTSSMIALGMNSGAYQAEILRVAVKGIPEEQLLVGRSLGLSEAQVLRHVVLPQAVRNSLPGLANEIVILLKQSSLASVIGVMELTRVGEYMTSATFRALEAYLLVALVYLAVSYAFFKLLRRTEKTLAIPGFERWV